MAASCAFSLNLARRLAGLLVTLVAPLGKTLVVSNSDSYMKHEVMPTFADR